MHLEHFNLSIHQYLCNTSKQEQRSTMTKEAQLAALEAEIKKLIEELETLDAREEEVKSPKSGIEQVEQGNLLRAIRLKRRNADKTLEEKSTERATLKKC